ncbi:MAG: DUF3857 domain-containing protein [Candidatus Aerophobetes bacterium]|nr:DUF3857 domain-containing protein [Candidatus Aerophobetes bacterium]
MKRKIAALIFIFLLSILQGFIPPFSFSFPSLAQEENLQTIASPVSSSLTKTHLQLGKEYAERSREFFERAISEYNLALKEPDADVRQIHLLLGKLYYEHGEFKKAIQTLLPVYKKEERDFSLAKLLALSYFKKGEYTDALAIFEEYRECEDEEFLFFYAKTCEEKNLYDKALELYNRIKGKEYKQLAQKRVAFINAQTKVLTTADISNPYIRELIKSSPEQKDYPNAGAIILLYENHLEILRDWTAIEKSHLLVKVLNDRGKEKYGEIRLFYDSTYEKVEIEYARTIKPDGKITPAGAKHIHDVSEYPEYPLYSNARLKIISMPELCKGAVVEYRVRKYINKLINKEDFCRDYGIQDYEPCLNKKITLTVPPDYKFKIQSSNPKYTEYQANFSPQVKIAKEEEEYIWEFKNIPEIISEPSMPPYVEITPRLSFSSFEGWEEIYRWWRELFKDKINLDEAIKKKAEGLIKGENTEEEKAKAIYHWVASKIRYVGVEYGEAGFEPHSATEIFKNKYGDCKDQTILLISMLRYAGIRAWPVLISTKGSWPVIENFPTLTFNHAIALAEVEGKSTFLDSTAETTSFGDLPSGDQNRVVFTFYDEEGLLKETPLFPSHHNRDCIDTRISVYNDETISGTIKISAFGKYDQGERWWLKYTKPLLIKEYFKSVINNLSPGGELLHYEISDIENLNQPIKIKIEFKGPKFLKEMGEERIIPQLGGLSAALVSREKRNYPLDFRVPDEFQNLFELQLPQNLEIKYLPLPVVSDTKWFAYINKYSFSGESIYFEERLVHKRTTVSVEEYGEFKRIYEEIARQADKQIILRKVEK